MRLTLQETPISGMIYPEGGTKAQKCEMIIPDSKKSSLLAHGPIFFHYVMLPCFSKIIIKRTPLIVEKVLLEARHQWLTPVILALRRQRSGGSWFKASPGK
jgi:hypothetical protein